MTAKLIFLITIMLLLVSSSCNNPNGGSVVSAAHTPLLKAPENFRFSSIIMSGGNVTFQWQASIRASEYQVYMGTSSSDITTAVDTTLCSMTNRTCTVTGLNPSTVYYFSVDAINAAGKTVVSPVGTALSVGTFDISSSNAGDAQIDLAWSNSSGATSYNVVYGTSSGSYSGILKNVSSPYTLTGLSNGVTYFVRVIAINSNNGYLASASEISGKPLGIPVVPTGMAATPAPGQIAIDWTNVAGAISYKVYRGTSSGALSLLASNVTTSTYTDSSTTNGITYFYAVKAYNGLDSALSSEVSGRSISTFSMNSLTAAPGANQLTATWSSVTGADSFDIQYGTNPASLTSTFTNVTSPYVMTALTGGVTYYVRVIAKNAVGTGAAQTSINQLFASPIAALAAPAGLTATATPGTISLSWSAVTGASTYEILRALSSGGPYTSLQSGIVGTTFSDTSATNGTAYYYVARSFNGYSSLNSTEASAKPINTFSISSLNSASSTSLQVTWPAVLGADAYDVVYGTTTGIYSGTVTGVSSPYTISGLAANTIYHVAVRARNSIGLGTMVASAEVDQKTSTAAPTSLVASATPGQVSLSWGAVAGATSYNVYRGNALASLAVHASGLTTASYTDSSVADGTIYYYTVVANNGADSAQSSSVSVRPIANFTFLSATIASATSSTLTWTAPAGATAYDVRYGTSPGVYNLTASNVTSPYTLTGLTAGSTYYFIIRSKNTTGAGTYIESSSKTLQLSAAAPTGVLATASTGKIDLSWSSVATATSYNIYRGIASGSLSQLVSNVTSTSYSDTSVTDGTQYYYAIRTFNGAESVDSTQVTGKSIAAFSISSLSAPSSTSLIVDWSTPAGAASFDVLYRTTPTGTYTTLSNKIAPLTITGLSGNTTYYVAIKAKNAIGSSTSTQTADVSQLTPVGVPAGLAAVSSNGIVNLSWTAVSNATSYKIYRGTSSGSYTSLATGVSTNSYSDTTVATGSTYFYVVTSFNGTDSAYSTEVSIKPIATFSIASTTVTGSGGINLAWPVVSGADSYDIKYGTTSGSYTSTLSSQTSPKILTGLASNTTYYFVIVAKNAVGTSSSQNTAEVSAKTSLTAPTSFAATAVDGKINLSWTATSGATSYNIYRGTSSGSRSLLGSTSTNSYTDTTDIAGTTYYYTVRGFNGTESLDSSEVSIKPIEVFSITSASVTSSSSIDVTWPTVAGADSYDLKYGTVSGSYTSTLSSQTSPKSLTGLAPNTTYYFMVVAKNAVGTGSSQNSAQVSATTAFGAPSGLTATATPSQVILNWSSVSSASSYKVFKGTASGVRSQIATPSTNTYTDTVTDGVAYFYTVRAFNGTDSTDSSEVSVKSISSFDISSSIATSSTSIEITWPTTSGADSYDLKYGTASGSYTNTLNYQTSPKTLTGLNPNTTYYFVVVAKNTQGLGTTLTTTQATVTTPFGAPSGLVATASPGQVGLNWTAVSGASSYKVFRGPSSVSLSQIGTSVTNAYMDSTAANGTTYFYTVRAFNGSDSADSNQVSIQPISSFALSAATAASASSINLTWGAATGATSYDVRYGTSPGVYLFTASNVTSPYPLTGLTSGTTYYVSIQAKNTVGSATTYNSNELNAKTGLGAPATLSLKATPGNVAVSWSAVSGATNYNVYRGTSSGSYSQIASAITGISYNDTPVINGTTYYYMIRSYNGIESVDSVEKSVQPIATFAITSATPASSAGINVTWPTTTGASTYDIFYGTSSGSYTSSALGVTSPYSITGLSAATKYYIIVRGSNAVGVATTFSTAEINATTATAAPTALLATTATGQVNLTWAAVTGALNYNIYRGTTTGVYTLLLSGVTATNYSDSSVSNGTQYFYVVRANNGTESANSNEATATSLGSFSISSISAPSSTSLQVTWSASSGATAYDLYYGTATGVYGTPVTAVTSPYTLSGLSANTTYYVKIKARNAIGSGSSLFSAESSQVTPVAAPTGLAATAGNGQVVLTWIAASGATSYKILRGTATGVYTQIASGISATSYTDTGLSNGTTYYYAIKSFNGSDSATSSEVFKQPIATPVISSVVSSSGSTMVVTWGAASGAASYDLKYGTSTGVYSTTVASSASPATVSSLTAGTIYFVQVVAKNTIGGGTSVNSAESSVTTNALPVISAIAAQTMEADSSTTVSFTLSDANDILTCAGAMSKSVIDTTLIPTANISFSGTLPNCIATITPASGKTGTTTLTFSATDGKDTVSQAFSMTVNPCTVASIEWVTQPPATTAAGSILATAPKVKLLKADGVSLCTTNTSDVSLTIGTDTSTQQDADVNSGDIVTPSGGYATFPAVVVQRASTGAGHTLNASQGSVTTTAESSAFKITALAASKIAFATQPSSVKPSVNMSPPVVQITDTYGNYLTSGTGTVSLALKTTTTTGGITSCTTTTATGVTTSGMSVSMTSGVATFSALQVGNPGNTTYCLSASLTGYTAVVSSPFTVLTLVPVNTASVIELLQGSVQTASTTNAYLKRGSIYFRPTAFDGTPISWAMKIVATNVCTSGTTAGTITFNSGKNTIHGTITVPVNTTVPTLFTTALTSLPTTAFVSRLYTKSGSTSCTLTVYSAKLIAKQTNATMSAIYIPLTSLANGATSVTTTTTTTTSSMASPLNQNFPSYTFNVSKFSRIDSVDLTFTGAGAGSCVTLYNKTTNAPIGSELCQTGSAETMLPATSTAAISVTPAQLNALTTDTEIEIRFRSSSGSTATLYKAGLMLNMVGLYNIKNIHRVVPATSTVASATNFNFQRFTSNESSYSPILPNNYLRCRAGAATSGSGSFVLKDYGVDNSTASAGVSTTTASSTITASSTSITNETKYTALNAGPLATTAGNNMFVNFNFTSGSFDIQHCLFEVEVSY